MAFEAHNQTGDGVVERCEQAGASLSFIPACAQPARVFAVRRWHRHVRDRMVLAGGCWVFFAYWAGFRTKPFTGSSISADGRAILANRSSRPGIPCHRRAGPDGGIASHCAVRGSVAPVQYDFCECG